MDPREKFGPRATKHEHVPIDFALYMPRSWTDDATRRAKARVPDELVFKTKPDLALDLITRAVEDKIPGDIVLVDAAYAGSSDFRNTVRMFGFDLGVAVTASTKVWRLDKIERRRGDPLSAQNLGVELGRRTFRRLTWRVGPGGRLSSHFAFRRVKIAHDDGTDAGDREPHWLVMEWPEGQTKPTKFILTTLPRGGATRRRGEAREALVVLLGVLAVAARVTTGDGANGGTSMSAVSR